MKGKLSSPRVVVKFRDHLSLPYTNPAGINEFFSKKKILPWSSLKKLIPGFKIDKLFNSLEPARILELTSRAIYLDHQFKAPDFLSYFTIDYADITRTGELIKVLLKSEIVEFAYLQNGPVLSPNTNLVSYLPIVSQGYLVAAPEGIDAAYASTIRGGNGDGQVKWIDIELGWNLKQHWVQIKTLPNSGISHYLYDDHATAVFGVVQMRRNQIGMVGIVPHANGHVISQWRPDGSFNTADAIMSAINELHYGDILLVEVQVQDGLGNGKVWPAEVQPAIASTIRLATALGITVVEPTGNGEQYFGVGNDLDRFVDMKGSEILNTSYKDFSDSGAIMVAAASSQTPHKRLAFSNYGKRVDCYAWGENVVTAGSYPASAQESRDAFTKNFGGTSAAAAIIAGAAIAIQNYTETNHHFRLSPNQLRSILRDEKFGTPSANGKEKDKIGSMPDLRKIVDHIIKFANELRHK
jgi:hypothetical protein